MVFLMRRAWRLARQSVMGVDSHQPLAKKRRGVLFLRRLLMIISQEKQSRFF